MRRAWRTHARGLIACSPRIADCGMLSIGVPAKTEHGAQSQRCPLPTGWANCSLSAWRVDVLMSEPKTPPFVIVKVPPVAMQSINCIDTLKFSKHLKYLNYLL